MNKFIALLCAGLFASAFFTAHKPMPESKINWMTWEQAQEAQKKKPKKIFVDVYTDWCGWCKKMDATTFSHPEIIRYLNENYYAIKFDAEQKAPILFKDKEYKFVSQGMRGYHELAAELMGGKMSYPTTLYLDEQLNLLSPVPGYLDPPTCEMILTFFGSNTFRNVKWEDYQKTFKGKI